MRETHSQQIRRGNLHWLSPSNKRKKQKKWKKQKKKKKKEKRKRWKDGKKESQRAVAHERVRVPAQDMVQSVTQLSLVQSSVGFSVRGAVRCHVSGQSLLPNPAGVTSTAARTAVCFLLLMRSCRKSRALRLYPSRSRRPGVSVSSRVTRWILQPGTNTRAAKPAELTVSCNPETS